MPREVKDTDELGRELRKKRLIERVDAIRSTGLAGISRWSAVAASTR